MKKICPVLQSVCFNFLTKTAKVTIDTITNSHKTIEGKETKAPGRHKLSKLLGNENTNDNNRIKNNIIVKPKTKLIVIKNSKLFHILYIITLERESKAKCSLYL